MTQKDAEVIAEKLTTHPDIEAAGVDGRLYPMSDAREAEQIRSPDGAKRNPGSAVGQAMSPGGGPTGRVWA